MPDNDPALRSVILYRLDSIDQRVSALVTVDSHRALVERVARIELEADERERRSWQLTTASIVAAGTAIISLLATVAERI